MSDSPTYTPGELASILHALHEAIKLRLQILPDPDHPWREVKLLDVQKVLDSMLTAYGKTMQELQDMADLDPNFQTTYGFTDNEWDVLSRITLARTWSEVPVVQ